MMFSKTQNYNDRGYISGCQDLVVERKEQHEEFWGME
jgi:hypothetical protein